MRSFLSCLASAFIASSGYLSDTCFVFPSRRAGLFFRECLAKQIGKPLIAPQMLTLADLFVQLSSKMPQPLRRADSIDLLFRLYDNYSSLNHNTESFEQFVYWGRMIISDFNEIDTHLVDAKKLLTTIGDNKAIDLEFAVDPFAKEKSENALSSSLLRERSMEFWRSLYPLYEKFRQELKSESLAYEGMLQRQVVEWLSADAAQLKKFGQVVFVGFNALTPVEEQLFRLFRDYGDADFYFDYSTTVLSDPLNNASLFFKSNTEQFSSHYELNLNYTELKEIDIRHVSVMTDVGQTLVVSSLLEQLFNNAEGLEAQPDATGSSQSDIEEELRSTAIVLADENMLLPMLYAVPDSIQSVNVTMGYPLVQTQVSSLVDSVFNLHGSVIQTDSCQYYYKHVMGILSNPLTQLLSEKPVQPLITRLASENQLYISPSVFGDYSGLEILFSKIDTSMAALQRLRLLLEQLIRVADKQVAEYAYSYLTIVNRVERQWVEHKNITDNLSITVLADMFRQLVQMVSIPFEGEPLKGLQIMGVLETRTLDFDNVIITSVNDEVFPHKSTRLSFISEHLRSVFGLPTQERAEAVTAYNFYRMVSHARRVWLISNVNSTDNKSGELSRYLLQLRYQYGIDIKESVVKDIVYSDSQTELAIKKNDFLLGKLSMYLTTEGRGLSPSALVDYLRCPLLFCLSHVLGYRKPAPVAQVAAPNRFGTIFHLVMKTLYEPYVNREISVAVLQQMLSDTDSLRRVIFKCYSSEMYNTQERNTMSGVDVLTCDVLYKYVCNVLEFDVTQAPFTYRDAERKVERQFTLSNGSSVRLSGTIDRIDSRNGETRVIDYKTGHYLQNNKVNLEFKDVAQLFESKDKAYLLQVVYYCALFDNLKFDSAITPHIYYLRMMSDKNTARTAVLTQGGFSFEGLKADFETRLSGVIEEMLNAEVDFQMNFKPNDPKCKNCQFFSVCQNIQSTIPTEETS
ncbi:MAG: PD-(D/E)XK nuclease family protein [Paludibacteraceae bacterium]|nr:PD-(D/E)XK nuclease family protein [Paludibacteraceae bacterium]